MPDYDMTESVLHLSSVRQHCGWSEYVYNPLKILKILSA